MDPIRRRESVCRSLFGPVDHEQLRRDLTRKLQEISEQDSRRWNFNFQTETPLCGRFQWEEIPAHCAAAMYQDDVCEEDDRLSKEEVEEEEEEEGAAGIDQENCSSISNTHKCPAEVTPVRRKRTLSKPAAKNRSNNARITDFFPKRRKTTETKSTQNPFHTSSNEAALCKTIR
ncbi:cyclin-dependent kinase inhibitor 1Ca [Etheostoma cragini]|uniref:cyclin-dependent kinase inhibitor 1Ca n=1 Tax=Etheostoma cragini TaxID=417921 RepID=UPI00155EFFDC|nr:cyclin-dependent kinase inhibitor 1Ca [Etheostoma cragini]